jgi:hypothetical protein
MLSLYGDALFQEDNSIFPLGSITYTAIVILIGMKMQYVYPPSTIHYCDIGLGKANIVCFRVTGS